MFSFLQKKQKEEATLCVCVVTSYTVTAAVVRVYKREGAVATPIVLFSCEEKISIRQALDSEMLEASVAEHARKVLEKCRSFHGVFDKVVYTIGEPWVTTAARTIHSEKMKPFKVTQKMIDELVSRDTKLFESELSRTLLPEDVGIIEVSKPILSVNGYPATDAFGVPVKTLDLQFAISYAPARLVEGLILAFTDVFHHAEVSFASMTTAASLLIAPHARAAILNVGGVSGMLALVDYGAVTHAIDIPNGLLNFEAIMMQEFDVHQSQVSQVMRFADDDKLLQHHRDLYYRRINTATRELAEGVYRSFLTLKHHVQTVPDPMYLIGNPAWIKTIEPFLVQSGEFKLVAPDHAVLDTHITYTHDAKVRHLPLSLAILQSVDKLY